MLDKLMSLASGHRKPNAAIMFYHRIENLDDDHHQLAVSPENFIEHMDELQKSYNVIGLSALGAYLRGGSIPNRSVVLTFDDGYSDNIRNAKRILGGYDMPATFFITTGMVGSQQEFWWDELEKIIMTTDRLPDKLCIDIKDAHHTWNFSTFSHEAVYSELHQLLRPMEQVEREECISDIALWAGSARTAREKYRALSLTELRELDRGGLVEIGAHTVTHPVLSTLSVSSQEDEIVGSKRFLEEALGHSIYFFSYPYGQKRDILPETVTAVSNAGFSLACSTISGSIESTTNPYLLPRNVVRDWGGKEFKKNLERWFNG